MRDFRLEEYLTKYEFSSPYLLCSSDAQTMSMQKLIELGDQTDQARWQNLSLSYTEPYGHPELREKIATSLYPGLSSENILCFAGAEEGIYASLNVLCQPGEHVIVITPCYQSLYEIPVSVGCEVSSIELKPEDAWKIQLDVIESEIKQNTSCIVINFPHNPTGQVIEQEELKLLVELCKKKGIWLFSDEVYRLLGNPNKPWAIPAACAYGKGLSLGVLSKAFGLPGLRVGWIACQDAAIIHRLKKFKDYLSICNSAPSEILSIIAIKNKDTIINRNNEIVKNNLQQLDNFIVDNNQLFSWVKPQGGCIGYVKYHSNQSTVEFCQKLVEKSGVLLMPDSVYDQNINYFRIGFGRVNMPESLAKLSDFIGKTYNEQSN